MSQRREPQQDPPEFKVGLGVEQGKRRGSGRFDNRRSAGMKLPKWTLPVALLALLTAVLVAVYGPGLYSAYRINEACSRNIQDCP